MRILIFTPMYPSEDDPHNGTFVFDEVSALKKIIGDVAVLHIDTRKSKLNYLHALAKLKKAINRFRPDIIHCHHTFCLFIAWLSGFRNLVLTFHEGEYTSPEAYLTLLRREGMSKALVLSKSFKRFCLRRAKHVFDVTGALNHWPNVTSPFSPGVNLKMFHPIDQGIARKKINWEQNKKYILFPGNPQDTCKRYDIAYNILEIINRYISMSVELFPLTNIPHNKVPLYMCASDVMLLVSDYEASPMVVKEAVACGLPCVCYDVGDVARVLEDVPNSFVVPPDEINTAEKIVSILKDRNFTRRNYLPEICSAEHVACRIKSVYKNLIKG